MNKRKIALAGPHISEREVEYVVDAVKNGWYETYDKHIKKLEETFASFVNAKYAITTYCGTHALHLAVLACGLKPGDEVIVTDQSFIATAHAVSYVGAKCVFVDIDPATLCMNPECIEAAITEKTRAIMAVDFAGFCAGMDRIKKIAEKHGLFVIEDACQAVGSKYQGNYAGTFGDIGVYSFQGSKIAVGGEGGMLVTDSGKLYEKALHYANFCRNDATAYLWSDDIGYNYRISNVTAALILAQIERIDELIERKRQIFGWYEKRLGNSRYIEMLYPPDGCESNYSYAVGCVKDGLGINRDKLIDFLIHENIHARPGYPSMSLMPHYERRFPVDNSMKYFKRGIVLPTALNLTEEDIETVCATINTFCREEQA